MEGADLYPSSSQVAILASRANIGENRVVSAGSSCQCHTQTRDDGALLVEHVVLEKEDGLGEEHEEEGQQEEGAGR